MSSAYAPLALTEEPARALKVIDRVRDGTADGFVLNAYSANRRCPFLTFHLKEPR